MNEFKATFSRMQNAAQDEAALSRELNQLESDINRVLNTLAIRSSHAANIRRALRKNIQNVSDARSKLNAMSSALSDIVRLYQSAENKITGSNSGDRTLSNKMGEVIQETWDKIKDISQKYGLNPSAAYSSDPVNLSNGNYVYEKVCMELETEMAMQFRIFYNIQNERQGSLGRGWMHTWEVSLERSEGRISMIQDDASRCIFLEENGTYQPAPGTNAEFRQQGEYDVVTDRNGISWFFESSGRLARMENLSGCHILLEYDQESRLCRVEDRRGNFFQFSYDDKGCLQSVEDGAMRKVTIKWDDGRLSMVVDPQGRKTAYHYDAHGWLTELVNGRGVTCLVNAYDDQGRTISQRFPDGGEMGYQYLDDKKQVVLTEQNGNQIIYEHDEFLRNTRTVYSDGQETSAFDENHNRTSSTDKRGNTSYYSYDKKGNLVSFRNALNDELTFSYTAKNQISQVELNGTVLHRADYDGRNLQIRTENANGAVDQYEYDQYGQPIVWEKADGSKVKLTYDEKGNLSSITNAAGGCTHYEYNDRNQVIRTVDPLGNETLYAYNDSDELTMVQDATGNAQTYDYDECGNVVRMTDASGAATVTEYNSMNKPVRVTEADGSQTLYEYDTMWNVTAVTAPDGGRTSYAYDQLHRLAAVTDANGGVNRMEYDPCGNLIRRQDPDGGIHQLGYDALNRPNYVCDPVGMEVRAEYDALGNVTAVLYSDGSAEHYEYDWLSHITMSQDRSGYQKFYEYDVLGNIKTVSDDTGVLEWYSYYPGGLLESEHYADGRSRTFYYDSNENVVKIANQDGNQWQFAYDCLGRVVCAMQDQGILESYEYDPLGNITAVIDGNGNRTSYRYSRNEIVSVTDALGNETQFAYDGCHRLTRVIQWEQGHVDADAINAFNREQQDVRITDYRYDRNGNLVESMDPEGNRVLYTYDGNNRILSQTDGDGSQTSCQYYPDGTVKSYHFADGKSVKLSYNPLKQLVQMEDWLGITRIQPDLVGRPEQVTMPAGETVSYEWGSRGEKKAMVYPDGMKVSYEYDDRLRLVQCDAGEDSISYHYYPNGKLKEKRLPDQVRTLYQYHPTGNIAEISHMKGEELLDRLTYQYDKNNRKSQIVRIRPGMEDDGIYQYQYNAVGSLISVLKNGREEEAYAYDAYGNRTFSRVRGREASYAYNRLNQLVKKTDQDGEHAYSYDCRGNLLLEQVGAATVRSLKFNAQGLLESVKRAGKTAAYQYNGFGHQVMSCITDSGHVQQEFGHGQQDPGHMQQNSSHIQQEFRYLYDITKEYNHLLRMEEGKKSRNLVWDGGLLSGREAEQTAYFLNDERMSPMRIVGSGISCAAMSFDSFGNLFGESGEAFRAMGKEAFRHGQFGGAAEWGAFGYAGYRPDPVSGFMHVNVRNYDGENGRFISRDPFPGMVPLPLTLNAYSYAMGDPINRYDPTGMIAIWLGAGIVGAVVNVTAKVVGDVVKSVSTGSVQVSSWQSYVGAAAGGFTYGVVATTAGPIAAGAASSAVESVVGNGLSMLTGAEGYRKEDGYSWKNLLGDATVDTTFGAIGGAVSNWIKVPGINKGRGSLEMIWNQIRTKFQRGQIANMAGKTMAKYLALELFNKATDVPKDIFLGLLKPHANSLVDILMGNKGNALCPVGA